MPFTVQRTIKKPKYADFYTPGLRNTLEHHLPFLRNHPDTERRPVSADDIYRFEGDLYGLLHYIGIETSQHWLIMRVNKMTSPTDLGKSLHDEYGGANALVLKIPPPQVVDQVKKRFRTKRT